MKKLALILALSFFLPIVAAATSHAASQYSDLAVGDPMGGGYHRARKRVAKPAASTTEATTSAPAAAKEATKPPPAPAEKAPAPAK